MANITRTVAYLVVVVSCCHLAAAFLPSSRCASPRMPAFYSSAPWQQNPDGMCGYGLPLLLIIALLTHTLVLVT